MKETQEILRLLQSYFDGNSTEADEKMLEAYFKSGEVAEELSEYAEFFGGISELAGTNNDENIEDEIMDYILENEHQEKTKYLSMWKMVTGIAASVIVILGGFLLYQGNQKPFDDTFKNPEEAYAYASKTLQFVSGKYHDGMAGLSNFDKLRKANDPVKKGTAPVVEFYNSINNINSVQPINDQSEPDSL